jgi:putative nucleotidyltransferase with HDIG domain
MNQGRPRRSGLLQAYIATVFVLGLVAFVDAMLAVAEARLPYQWTILAALAVLSQFSRLSSLKVPGVTAHLSVSEILLFMLVLMYGWAPAVVTLGVDGLTFSLKQELRRKRNSNFDYLAFDFAEPALSMWVAAQVYFLLAGLPPLWLQNSGLADIALPALAMGTVYFAMNSGLSTLAEAMAARTSPWPLWQKHFQDLGANYFSSVSIAAVLADHLVGAGLYDTLKVLAVIAPMVIASYYVLAMSMRSLADQKRHVAEKEQLNLTLAEALAMTAEAKDRSTSRGHIRRVRTLAMQLAHAAGLTDPEQLQAIEFGGLLHDYGKTGIPEHILNKPGKLTEGEYEVMKTHASVGADMVSRIGFPFPVVPIIRHHHENWDGSGYPDNLQGDAIPLGARILSVVDCYDALRDHRPYRRALSHDQAMKILRERSGTMYDPAIIAVFESLQDQLKAFSFQDAAPGLTPAVPPTADPMPAHPEDGVAPLPLELRLSCTRTLAELLEELSSLSPDAGVDATCGLVSRQLLRLAPASLVVFYRRDDATDEIAAAYASGFGEALMGNVRMPLGHKVSGWVAVNNRSVINADSTLDVDDLLDRVEPRFRSLLSVPLPCGDRTIGVVTLYAFQERAFREEQRQALELVRDAIGRTFWRALQHDRSRVAAAASVGVTTPGDRRSFDALLAMDDRVVNALGPSVGLLCVKNTGDPGAMADAAMAVTKAVRVADLIYSPTADSLVVLMRDSDPDAGRIVTQRIAESLPANLAPWLASSPLRIGYACSPHDGDTIRQLLEKAVARLASPLAGQPAPEQAVRTVATPARQGGRS